LLSVFCPHIAEEFWEKIKGKGFISLAEWPKPDLKKIDAKLEQQEGVVDKLLSDIDHVKKLTGKTKAQVYVYVLPNELDLYKNVEGVKVFAVNDKSKHDPEGKSKKVKPGRPGIYLE
jgi:leucyl-tRNA synthetase